MLSLFVSVQVKSLVSHRAALILVQAGGGGVYESGFTVRLKVKLLYWITFWDLYNKLETWCEVRMPRSSTEYRIGDRKTFSPWKGVVN